MAVGNGGAVVLLSTHMVGTILSFAGVQNRSELDARAFLDFCAWNGRNSESPVLANCDGLFCFGVLVFIIAPLAETVSILQLLSSISGCVRWSPTIVYASWESEAVHNTPPPAERFGRKSLPCSKRYSRCPPACRYSGKTWLRMREKSKNRRLRFLSPYLWDKRRHTRALL